MKKFWDNAPKPAAPSNCCDNAVNAGFEALPQPAVPPARAAQVPVPGSLQIGSVTISPATVLAPMAGVTDTVFRRFIRNLGGCGLIMTEFTSADGVLRAKDRKAKRYLHFYEDEHPISAQLFGSDPKVMADAARIVEDLGFDLVDLNLGCPAKKVVKCNGGSGLLRDLPRIGEIFKAVRTAVKTPFTVKFRAGWNDEEIVCVELAKMAEDCGLCAVALHARTREQGYSGNARWEWIAAVKDAVKIPVIGNGDIRTPEDACAMVAATGCDAVMIGRTAPANPWIFRQIEQYCEKIRVGTAALGCPSGRRPEVVLSDRPGGSRMGAATFPDVPTGGHGFSRAGNDEFSDAALAAVASGAKAPVPLGSSSGTTEVVPSRRPEFGADCAGEAARGALYEHPSEADRYQMIRTYFQMLIEEELPDATGKMKQFASWFTHGVPGGAALRKEIYESKAAPEILSRVENFFEQRLVAPVAAI
ncbi:MAG TPA: tRNA dihydrouridine synthase DusB [Terriglobales bacterium]|nr:tRNA dihydrouridine synthase DusB [Terriglobales bacterium]